MQTPRTLDREMYTEAHAARLLGLSQGTLNYWLEGGTRREKLYQPVIREAPRGYRAPVTWSEFVEAGFLRMYRQDLNVPMRELRAFIDILRSQYGVPYPLADRRPFVNDRQLVIEAQDEAGLDPEFCLVAVVRDQPLLTPPSQSFFDRVSWDGNAAAAWRPHDDERSPVRIAPGQRGGQPAIGGISTEIIWEHDESGESIEEIADTFDLSEEDVRWAISYEAPRAA